ncbi:G-protein coupled receptor GRL101-like [Littorina saxatilis]|uniref:G-protein coupled receptor GRL101-like n=1 Tax=Littorina saxatilis TaxID=31220 RepID=UPI0038B6466E
MTTCPGFYHCRGSGTCVHPDHVCDGLYQCPQHDDELFCSFTCPLGCTCYGLSFQCHDDFQVEVYPQLRYLDASKSGLSLGNLTKNRQLVHLDLSKSGLSELQKGVRLPNLRSLYLSDNSLKVIPEEVFRDMRNLRSLSLAGNPLSLLFQSHRSSSSSSSSSAVLLSNLKTLDLSRVPIAELQKDTLVSLGAPNLEVLNFTDCGVQSVGQSFQALKNLRVLDLTGCPMSEFPLTVFKDLNNLETVLSDNYKLCCRSVLPLGFDISGRCVSPEDEVSSCDSLLRSNYYRFFVYTLAAFAVLGNIGSMSYRIFVNRRDSTQTASVFVSNLCMANFIMGVYLVIVAAADWNYRGSYVSGDNAWRKGIACKTAGFLFVLSNEVSVFLVCLMTFDRYLILRRPLSVLNFKKWSAHGASVAVWIGGFVLAGVPLLPVTSHWRFYSRSGLCVPLPVSRDDYPGHVYAFVVFNVVKFVIFLVVAVAQALIYIAVRGTRHSMIAVKSKKSMDAIVARRLAAVVMTDFLSWFPIGLLGVLASAGLAVSSEVQVVLAILVLPLNSALNPLLYTLSMAADLKRSRMKEKIRVDVLSQARRARLAENETRAVSFAITSI